MAERKSLYMESTEIAPEKTAAEIVFELVKAGATQVNTGYAAGMITGLRWIMRVGGDDVLFAMPVRVDPIYKIFYKRRVGYLSKNDEANMMAKARRVAWRQLLRWVQAQMAMIDCGMVAAHEVFLPYVQVPSGQSLYQLFEGGGMKLLTGGPNA